MLWIQGRNFEIWLRLNGAGARIQTPFFCLTEKRAMMTATREPAALRRRVDWGGNYENPFGELLMSKGRSHDRDFDDA